MITTSGTEMREREYFGARVGDGRFYYVLVYVKPPLLFLTTINIFRISHVTGTRGVIEVRFLAGFVEGFIDIKRKGRRKT